MMQRNASSGTERITQAIMNTLENTFAEPEFDSDNGVVKFLDRDARCVWLGLFHADEEGDVIGEAPAITWTIEVTFETKEQQ